MDFGLSKEQALLQNIIRRSVEEQCPREYARELEQTGEFPEELWRKMAGLGFLDLPRSF
ncbi:MAG: acyl-CoA dehydrogenase family protein [Deltaproteobacteria bacterium]|nr:acyl-CoA dehydrogenase family protein [Deltaproteobacteria bacterium]